SLMKCRYSLTAPIDLDIRIGPSMPSSRDWTFRTVLHVFVYPRAGAPIRGGTPRRSVPLWELDQWTNTGRLPAGQQLTLAWCSGQLPRGSTVQVSCSPARRPITIGQRTSPRSSGDRAPLS